MAALEAAEEELTRWCAAAPTAMVVAVAAAGTSGRFSLPVSGRITSPTDGAPPFWGGGASTGVDIAAPSTPSEPVTRPGIHASGRPPV